MIVEPHAEFWAMTTAQEQQLRQELVDLASRNPLTRRIEEVMIRCKPLPVDIRHNSKIFREKLAAEIA